MPVKKSGLGKGLDSLIPNKNVKSAKPSVKADEKKAAPKEEILEAGPIMVKINKVEPNREQPRKDFDEDALMELADSIKQFGVLQPILVQRRRTIMKLLPVREDGARQSWWKKRLRQNIILWIPAC